MCGSCSPWFTDHLQLVVRRTYCLLHWSALWLATHKPRANQEPTQGQPSSREVHGSSHIWDSASFSKGLMSLACERFPEFQECRTLKYHDLFHEVDNNAPHLETQAMWPRQVMLHQTDHTVTFPHRSVFPSKWTICYCNFQYSYQRDPHLKAFIYDGWMREFNITFAQASA